MARSTSPSASPSLVTICVSCTRLADGVGVCRACGPGGAFPAGLTSPRKTLWRFACSKLVPQAAAGGGADHDHDLGLRATALRGRARLGHAGQREPRCERRRADHGQCPRCSFLARPPGARGVAITAGHETFGCVVRPKPKWRAPNQSSAGGRVSPGPHTPGAPPARCKGGADRARRPSQLWQPIFED